MIVGVLVNPWQLAPPVQSPATPTRHERSQVVVAPRSTHRCPIRQSRTLAQLAPTPPVPAGTHRVRSPAASSIGAQFQVAGQPAPVRGEQAWLQKTPPGIGVPAPSLRRIAQRLPEAGAQSPSLRQNARHEPWPAVARQL